MLAVYIGEMQKGDNGGNNLAQPAQQDHLYKLYHNYKLCQE